jgi:hypothetical protein
MSVRLERRNSPKEPAQPIGTLFTTEDARKIARAVRLELRVSDDDAAHSLNSGAELFLVRFLLERKSPTSPAEIVRWGRDVEKAAGKLFGLLDQAGLPWLHVISRKDMPAWQQARAAQLLGEHPAIPAVYGVAWLHGVGRLLAQEYQGRSGRRSHATVGLTAFVRFTQGAFRELFGQEPKVGSITELVGRDDADGGRQRFMRRDGPFIRFMKGTAKHLAARVRVDDPEIAAALRRWTKGDTLADKARFLPREHFSKKS